MEQTFDAERTIELSFTERDFPNWKRGEILPAFYQHPDGTRLRFRGAAVVEEVTQQLGAMVRVKIGHYPRS